MKNLMDEYFTTNYEGYTKNGEIQVVNLIKGGKIE